MEHQFRKILLAHQRRLYEEVLADLSGLESLHTQVLEEQRRDYAKSTMAAFDPCLQRDMLDACRRHSLVIFGDFHTFKQAQRGFLRLLRQLIVRKGAERLVIALECFYDHHQQILDQFVREQIDESQLLETTQYKIHWGFPWENYRDIVFLARAKGIPILAINSLQRGPESYVRRDHRAAQILLSAHHQHPKKLILCQLGEYHLGDQALLASIESLSPEFANKSLRIYLNIDRHFLEHEALLLRPQTAYLKGPQGKFAIMNSSPWVKWMSALIWDEQLYAEENDDGFDWDHFFLRMMRDIYAFLNVPHREVLTDHFELSVIEDHYRLSQVLKSEHADDDQVGILEQRFRLRGFVVLGNRARIYFRSKNPNSMVAAAATFILQKVLLLREHNWTAERLNIFSGIFSTLVLKSFNPKVKTESYYSLCQQIAIMQRSLKKSQQSETLKSMLRIKVVIQGLLKHRDHPSAQPSLKSLSTEEQYRLACLIGTDLFLALINPRPIRLEAVMPLIFDQDHQDSHGLRSLTSLLALSRVGGAKSVDEQAGAA